jgi:MFS family permease
MKLGVRNTAQLSEREHHFQLRRAVIASTIGTAIEWYDFFLYGITTGLVFARLYFPQSEPLVGTLQAFSVYSVGFAARPIGAALFGHYGDRIGRKATLIATLLVMGVATFLVGLVPTYEQVGVWGAVILTLLRFLQGIGVGGEWGGSVLLAMEWARTNAHRGLVASLPQLGAPLGLFLANVAILLFSLLFGDAFLSWGWRIPFLLSIALVGVGLYIRLGILETPKFSVLVTERKTANRPVIEVLRDHPREILLSVLLRITPQTSSYIFMVFVFSYGTTILGISRDFLVTAVLVGATLACFAIPVFGFASDGIGRKRMYLIGIVATAIFAFVYFAMLDTRSLLLVFLAIAASLTAGAAMWGPEAALLGEMFQGRLRYSGASIGYHFVSLFAGGPAPLIATALLARYRTGMAVAAYLLVCAVVSFVATLFVQDRTNKGIDERDYDAAAG